MVTEKNQPGLEAGNHLHVLSDVLLRRYLLRGLMWCQRCDEPWVPILLPPMARYYACSNKECPHPAMAAKLMEQRVWSRFVAINQLLAEGGPWERRHDVLHELLKRVVVGWWIGEVRLEWRE